MDVNLLRGTHIRLVTALLAAAALACALAAAASATPLRGTSAGAVMRIGRSPAPPAHARPTGTLPQSTPIRVTVALSPRNPAALAAYAGAVSTPASPHYRRYLSVAQFERRFAPGAAAVASVRAALAAEGLRTGALAANGLSFDVSAPAARMATAFATSFKRYRLAGGRTAFANTVAPALPASVSGLVQGVVGLDSLAIPRAAGRARPRAVEPHAGAPTRRDAVAPGETQACSGAAGSGAYTAGQIAAAYGLGDLYSAGNGGSGATVAIFELEPYRTSDIAAYQSCYGTNASVTNVAVDGGPGIGPGSGEAALDIEDVIGLAPGASILVYEGTNYSTGPIDTYRAIITQDRAKVISTSWGLCEPNEGTSMANVENTLFQEAAVQGQTIFAATGDRGVQDCTYGARTTIPEVDDPASQPYVTGVGGTSLTSIGPPPAESTWNSNWNSTAGAASGAGGGGVSRFWAKPSYQGALVPAQSAIPCVGAGTTCREVPDVSADADINTGYAIRYEGAWSIFGGTSAAAPTWAALAALADASPACSGRSVGFANPALYAAASDAYGHYFNDVVSGNNSFGGVSGFTAATGYDMTTGLGSPKGAAVAAAMCGSTWTPPAPPATTTTTTTTQAAPAPAPVVTLTRPPAQSAPVGQPVRVQLHATDSAGGALSWRAAGLPPGLSISKTSGLISGTPTKAGKATATVSVSDAAGSSATARIAWNIAGRPTITGGLTVNRQGKPSLALRVIAGTNAPAIRSIVVVPSTQIRFARRSRDLTRGITVRTASGHRLAATARLRSGNLVVTLRAKTVRMASLRVTVPAVTLVKAKRKKSGKQRPSALQHLTVTVTDVSSHRTALPVR